MMLRLLVPLLALLGGCHSSDLPRPPAPYTPSDRDGLDTDEGKACAHLRDLGCPEGWENRWENRQHRTCYEIVHAAADLVPVPSACLIAAGSIDDVRACGSPATLRVRCIQPSVWGDGSRLP